MGPSTAGKGKTKLSEEELSSGKKKKKKQPPAEGRGGVTPEVRHMGP